MADIIQTNETLAVVVTYNRLDKLKICIEAIKAQTAEAFDILIVDNCSTDNTKEYLETLTDENIHILYLPQNYGGSGGFYMGLKWAYEHGYASAWIMDDDVMPKKDALQQLLNHRKHIRGWSFLASCVYTEDGKAINTPEVSGYKTNGYRFWYDKLEYGMMRLAHATFVSLLINLSAVKKCGLPCKDYFIWGDDTEYTQRIIGHYNAAYLVGKSKVYHLRESGQSLSLINETKEGRIPMYRNLIRNTLLNASAYGGKGADKRWIAQYEADCARLASSDLPFKDLKIATIKAGIDEYVNGKYNVEGFRHRFEVYGQATLSAYLCGMPQFEPFLQDSFDYAIASKNAGISLFNGTIFIPDFLKKFFLKEMGDEGSKIVCGLEDVVDRPLSYNEYLFFDANFKDMEKATFARPGEQIVLLIPKEGSCRKAVKKAARRFGYKLLINEPTKEELDYRILQFAENFVKKADGSHIFAFVNEGEPCLESLFHYLPSIHRIDCGIDENIEDVFKKVISAIRK